MSARHGPGLGAFLAGSFLLGYFAARQLGVAPAVCEAMMSLPASYAAVALGRRARSTSGPQRRFYALLGSSALCWAVGQLLWARAVAQREDPALQPGPLLDLFFVGFVVPALAAALLGPGPRLFRPDPLDRTDATLSVVALSFVFLRLVFLPNIAATGLQDPGSLLLGLLCLALGAVASTRFFFADEAEARRAYGLLVPFAVTYGVGSALANGIGPMPPPGSLLDLAWFVPFFVLAAVGSSGRRPWERLPSWGLALLVGPLPLLVDALSRRLWPGGHQGSELRVSLTFAALVGIGCAIRLSLQEARDAVARRRDLERLEEERRSGRLDSLSSVTGPLLSDLRRAVEALAFRALSAEAALGSEASLVRQQVERALSLTREIETALGRGRLDPRREVDVARLLEETLQAELDAGLPLRVRLAAGALPPVVAEPRSLAAAFRELARNAAQASPGGTLEVRGERDLSALVLRFADDGPGIPEEIRASVFDPFFTTGRAGAGAGLGLTLVHFVARELGGSVRLEPGGGRGAAIVMRLPLADRRSRAQAARPLALPVLLTAALATLVSVTSGREPTSHLARGASCLAAFAAALELVRAARSGGARTLFALLALGALLAGALPLLVDSSWRTLADWPWAAAVLLPLAGGGVAWAGRRTVLALALGSFLAAHAVFVVLPLLAAGPETPLASAFAGGFLRLTLAAAAALLAARAPSDEARGSLEALSLALALWAAAASAGPWLRGLAPAGAVRLTDLAVVLPLLLLWRLGRDEAGRGRRAVLLTAEAKTHDLSAQARTLHEVR